MQTVKGEWGNHLKGFNLSMGSSEQNYPQPMTSLLDEANYKNFFIIDR
jgi:hypothetical protein